jgi:hypothetical protein
VGPLLGAESVAPLTEDPLLASPITFSGAVQITARGSLVGGLCHPRGGTCECRCGKAVGPLLGVESVAPLTEDPLLASPITFSGAVQITARGSLVGSLCHPRGGTCECRCGKAVGPLLGVESVAPLTEDPLLSKPSTLLGRLICQLGPSWCAA